MKRPSILISLIPLVLMIALLALGSVMFGNDLVEGPAQISMLTAALVAMVTGVYFLKVPWSEFQKSLERSFGETASAIVVILMIGALGASWMMSGVVPTIIVYGLEIISPKLYLAVTFVLCGVVSALLGSSWATVGTIGLALLSAGKIIGIPSQWLAGAVISGAYLGDKVSPLSDTTIIASTVSNVDITKHIKYMMITTVPAVVITLIVFLVAGFTFHFEGDGDVSDKILILKSTFNISPWLILIPVVTLVMVIKKVNVIIALLISSIASSAVAYFVQPLVVSQICDSSAFCPLFYTMTRILAGPSTIVTGNEMIDSMASCGGMSSMWSTVWLIISLLVFSSSMSATGMLARVTELILRAAKTTFSLIFSTMFACLFCNVVLADQDTAILVPGNMFKDAFRKKGLAPEVLSRTLEDCGTTSSVLVPWNTCGVVQASVLGVATLAYLPYCIFNLISPVVGLVVAAFGYRIHKLDKIETKTI